MEIRFDRSKDISVDAKLHIKSIAVKPRAAVEEPAEVPVQELRGAELCEEGDFIKVSPGFKRNLAEMVEHGRSGGNVKVSIMNAFMQKFMDELRNSKNKDSYLGIVSNGSHHTIYYKTANGVRRSFSLWLPHHMDSVYYSAGGISSAIDAMDRICYVPGSEKQGQT